MYRANKDYEDQYACIVKFDEFVPLAEDEPYDHMSKDYVNISRASNKIGLIGVYVLPI